MESPKTSNIKWANAVPPELANGDTPHKKRGRPFGSHTKWRTKEEIDLEKAWKELHRRPEEPEWPGPFVPRTDFPELVRKAYWINCGYCGSLFCRPVTWVKTRSRDAAAGHGTGGTVTFCSIGCGKSFNVKPVFRICVYCSKTFRVWANNHHRLTCCPECAASVMSERQTTIKHMPLIAYAFEHGVMAEYESLSCDLCGAGQKPTGKTEKTRHWFVRISEVDGKYISRCKYCYQKAANAQKAIEAAMTPAEKLRRKEAQELLAEVLKQ